MFWRLTLALEPVIAGASTLTCTAKASRISRRLPSRTGYGSRSPGLAYSPPAFCSLSLSFARLQHHSTRSWSRAHLISTWCISLAPGCSVSRLPDVGAKRSVYPFCQHVVADRSRDHTYGEPAKAQKRGTNATTPSGKMCERFQECSFRLIAADQLLLPHRHTSCCWFLTSSSASSPLHAK